MTKHKQEQPDKTGSKAEKIKTVQELLEDGREDCPIPDKEFKDASRTAEVAAQLEEKCRQVDELNDRYTRLQADFANFRRRSLKEKEDITAVVTERIVCELLPIMDNFERAVDMANSPGNAANLTVGMEMIFRQFNSTLSSLGVEPIEALDCQFDPAWHEAVARVADDNKPEGTIVSQIQKGYKLKGRVIRPSMVNVVGD